jgi:CHAT domain-containing protein
VAAGEAEPDADEAPVKVAQVRDAASGLGRLPHARAEGRAAVKALGGGLLLMGAEASEAQVATLPLGDFGLVHFAAHAITDEDRPERSAVLLAPGAAGYDGRLESAEIAGLHLEGRTVVLASCRSASGSVLRGEGVMSLARAFFQAGAHGVVASLWPLRDDESAALFDRFYRHLAGGESVAAALHGARADAIEAGEPAAAWAGLVVLGDGSVVPVPGGRASAGWSRAGWAALWLLLALALAAGAVAAWRARA